ncbi:hypothetical protein A3L14_00610 [Thermococcus thioreducens]|uniref:Uncharacterized protein n=1 Tax=Thermococcus thioreducens TaxID=277988 RepID=A0A0Q2M214_9EURY|nr:hypothetical protein A3L14_00610 [Thermococcus thioreducens]KQH81906.1 hypothetical protein AMR53_09215 [Thermococcus thioreducens]SEW05989.1 hypothetical protein SAMN05216170_1312 [Thermococcus thioreducens]
MRSLSIIFLFVLMGFLVYTTMMYGASHVTDSNPILLIDGETRTPAPLNTSTASVDIPLIDVSNNSVVNSASVLLNRLASTQVSYSQILSGVELVSKLSLIAVIVAVSLLLLSDMVVR